MRGFNACESFCGTVAHFEGDMQVGPESGCGEEAGDHGIEAGSHRGALAGKIGTDNAEMLPQLGQIPAISAKDADPHARLNDGVDLACNREDQRGFAASVGAEDGNMLSGTKIEVHIMQNDPVAPGNVDVFEFEKLFGIDRDCNIVRIL